MTTKCRLTKAEKIRNAKEALHFLQRGIESLEKGEDADYDLWAAMSRLKDDQERDMRHPPLEE